MYDKGKQNPIALLTAAGDLNSHLKNTFMEVAIDYKKGDFYLGQEYFINSNNDLYMMVAACVRFITDQYKLYLNYARRQIGSLKSSSE